MSIWPQAMSYFRPSRAADRVRPVIGVLGRPCRGRSWAAATCAEIEPLLMIRPPRGSWAFITRNASRMPRKAPVRLVSTTRRQSSTVRSSSGTGRRPIPALLKRRSTRPNAPTAASNRARTESGSVTSVGTASARGPAPPARAIVSARASGRRPAIATEYPSRQEGQGRRPADPRAAARDDRHLPGLGPSLIPSRRPRRLSPSRPAGEDPIGLRPIR